MRSARSVTRTSSNTTTREDLARFVAYRADPTVEKRNEIVARHLELAESIARRFARRGEPLDDLVQVASFGLIKSVERFDPDVGSSFVAFAIPTMVGEIKRHFRDRTWTIHVSRPTKDLIPRLRDTTEQLTVELGRSPTAIELAHALDVGVDTVLEALEARGAYRAMSLNSPPEYSDRAVDVSLATVDQGLVSVVDRLTVERLLSKLPAREKRIVELRFFGELTQSEIAARVGISQMHVSRLLRKALERLDDLDGEVA
jgi:RNA polymerase sigma-B factor